MLRASLRHSTLRGRRCRTCHQCNCRLIWCDWTSTCMLSICSLCLQASPRSVGYLPLLLHISSPESPSSRASPVAGSLPDEAAELCDSAIGSPATSLSITDHTANLQLLTPPLIPLLGTILVQADPALLLELTQTYQDFFLLPQEPVPAVD